ncbi:unnamed protein product [Euphydryas editha]|uniref:Uncharacterized protein n=1 Tax=Euphydryas editha TaxID=104508 RepID=A0AAU9UHG3_EUPED|nr:unnamed protein product [Euphydryas editha]
MTKSIASYLDVNADLLDWQLHFVCTWAFTLLNCLKKNMKCNRLTVNEAIVNHFGAQIVIAGRLLGTSDVVLIGAVNQLPYTDRGNLFKMRYCIPYLTTKIKWKLSCKYRSHINVTSAISEVFKNIYSLSVHTYVLQRACTFLKVIYQILHLSIDHLD